MPSVQCIGLFQNGPCSEITSVSDESEWSGVVREGQNRGCGKGSDEGLEGGFCHTIQMNGVSFFVRLKRGLAMVE